MAPKYTITIKGTEAFLEGPYDVDLVKEVTSYPVAGAHFSPLYKRGVWDGRVNLLNKKRHSFPFGLTELVVEALRPSGEVLVVDETVWPEVQFNGFDLQTIEFGAGRYDYQRLAAEAFLEKKRGILKLAVNAGKTSIAAALTKHLNIPTLFVCPGIDLIYQTARVFSKYLGVPESEFGMIGDGQFSVGKWITFAVIDSLSTKLDNKDEEFLAVKDSWKLLFIDEVHVAASDTAFKALSAISAPYRCGLSATPYNRSDSASLRLTAQTGGIIYEVRSKLLVERGISVQPHLHLLQFKSLKLDKRLPWADVNDKGVVNNKELNRQLASYGHKYAKDGDHVIFMVDKIAQGNNIIDILKSFKPEYGIEFIKGDLDSETRKKCLADFVSGKTRVLVGTSVLSTGIDMSVIDVIVLCGGGKAAIPQIQRVGRGMRSGSGRDKVIVADVMNFSHKHLIKHSQCRLKTYKEEDMFLITVVDE